MFNVRYRYWDDWEVCMNNKETKVYEVKEEDGETKFLINENGNWKWVSANDCECID